MTSNGGSTPQGAQPVPCQGCGCPNHNLKLCPKCHLCFAIEVQVTKVETPEFPA